MPDEHEEPAAGTCVPSEEMTSEGKSSEMSAEDKPKRNPRSAGHLELCRRPFLCFALGQCINLADCNYFLPHSYRSATLDKNQRHVIKEMDQREFLDFLLRCLPSKAVEGGFELEAQDVLQLFEAQLSQVRATPSKVPKPKVMNFKKAITRMTTFRVASLTSRVHLSTNFIDTIKEKVFSIVYEPMHRYTELLPASCIASLVAILIVENTPLMLQSITKPFSLHSKEITGLADLRVESSVWGKPNIIRMNSWCERLCALDGFMDGTSMSLRGKLMASA